MTRQLTWRVMAATLFCTLATAQAAGLRDGRLLLVLCAMAALVGYRVARSIADPLARQNQGLEDEHQRLDGILNGLQDGVLVADASGRVVYANPSASHLLGCPASDLVGARADDEDREARGQVLATLKSGAEFRDLLRIPERDRHLTLHTFEIAGRGSSVGRVAVLHNVSDYVRVDRMRRKFVANASHELRTPVTALAAALEALHLGAKDDPENREAFLARASREADRLRELAQDLLDLTAAEEPGPPTTPGVCDAGAAVREVFEQFSAAASARQQALRYDAPGGRVAGGMAPNDLSRALGNVVDNAIKYTPAGGTIRLAVRPVGEQVEITVTDNGPGIEPRYLYRIFERFYRIDKGRSRAVGGTGLGLSISRHLLERSGGSIRAENAPGGGACFRLRLPLPSVDSPDRIPDKIQE